jgi:hypothetical protein
MPDQRSLYEQLRDLVQLANRAGMYDAADFVRGHVERIEDCIAAVVADAVTIEITEDMDVDAAYERSGALTDEALREARADEPRESP